MIEAYDRSYRELIRRSRLLRVGLVLLIAVVGACLARLAQTGDVAPIPAARAIGACGCLVAVAVGMVTIQWMAAQRRLRAGQADRMVRAVIVQSTLAPDRVNELAGQDREARERTFDAVHDSWTRGRVKARRR